MPRLRSRAVVAALGAGLVLPALATLPSQAVVGSGTVSFNDCDVILNPLAENDPVTQNGTWSTTTWRGSTASSASPAATTCRTPSPRSAAPSPARPTQARTRTAYPRPARASSPSTRLPLLSSSCRYPPSGGFATMGP